MKYRKLSGTMALALAVALALPGPTDAASASTVKAKATSPGRASAVGTPVKSSARPEANAFRTVGGRQYAVPAQSTAPSATTPRTVTSGTALYVNSNASASCSDTAAGAGTQAVPYCTLQAAANVVVAGDTVLVAPGAYAAFSVKAKGTATAPITFESSVVATNPLRVDSIRIARDQVSGTSRPAHTIDVEGSSYLNLDDFWISEYASSDAVLVNGSDHVTMDNFADWVAYSPTAQPAPDIHISGDSTYVSVLRASMFNGNRQPYIKVDAGGSNDTIADSAFWGDSLPPVIVAGTPNTEITGNSFLINYSSAISLTGNSPGSTVENNVVAYNGFIGVGGASVAIGTGSTAGTTLDYNVVENDGSGDYQWGGATYTTAAALRSATGQGSHEINATADVYVGGDVIMMAYDSPGIDSANAAAPGEQSTDIYGQSCVDDPSYPITGAGTPAYCSRGSYQYQDPLSGLLTAAETGSMSATVDATQSHGLHPITKYSIDFGDGSAAVVNTTGKATRTYVHSGGYSITVTVTDSTGATNTSAAAWITTAGADFTPITPVRVIDTRTGLGTSGTTSTNKVGPGSFVTAPVPAAAAARGSYLKALAINVTVTNATGSGGSVGVSWYTSILNYSVGQTVAGSVIAPIDMTNGTPEVTILNPGKGTIDVIVDVTGYFATDSTSGYQPVTPARLLDTRTGTGGTKGALSSTHSAVLTVAGADGGVIPSSGVTAVAVNLTAVNSAGGGNVVAYPDGTTPPGTSNINFGKGQTVANFAVVPVGADGKIDLADPTLGATDMTVDVVGYFDSAGGSGLVDVDAYRVIDTRNADTGFGCNTAKGAVAAHASLTTSYPCPSLGSYSTAQGNVTAVVVTNTVASGTSSGSLDTNPVGGTAQTLPDLDWQRANQIASNTTFAATGSQQKVTYTNASTGSVQLIVDVLGFFTNS